MDGQNPASAPDPLLQRAIAHAQTAWDNAIDPVSAARAAARCFREFESPEAAFWRGSFLTQGYMAASTESSFVSNEVRALRAEGVDSLREATRAGESGICAQARYLLGQVDRLDRFGSGGNSPESANSITP